MRAGAKGNEEKKSNPSVVKSIEVGVLIGCRSDSKKKGGWVSKKGNNGGGRERGEDVKDGGFFAALTTPLLPWVGSNFVFFWR